MVDNTSSTSDVAEHGYGNESLSVDIRGLVSEHYGDVYRYAYRLSGRQPDAEDLTQQTFLVAQAKLHQLREPAKAIRWLFAVLRSCFLKSVGRPRPVLIDATELTVEDIAESTEDSLIDQEALQFALRELPDDYRLVVLMFYFEELSYKEIAEVTGIPMGTVMSRLSRARQAFRGALNTHLERKN